MGSLNKLSKPKAEKVFFSGIRKEIIKELESAEKNIRIAMAWFTNYDLFKVLCDKLDKGVKIELIIIFDEINNRPDGLDFQKFIDKGGKLFLNYGEKVMHHKFCIIDKKVVINGSYNWTYYAESRNFENIIIHFDNKLINSFNSQFNAMIKQAEKTDSYKRPIAVDIHSGFIDYILEDSLIKSKELEDDILKDRITELQNKRHEKIIQEIKKKKYLRRALGIGLKDDRYMIILPKNTELPVKKSGITVTTHDYQRVLSTPVYFGENNKGSANSFVGALYLKDIQEKPAGKVSFINIMELDENGVLKVLKKENGTKNQIEDTYKVDYLIT